MNPIITSLATFPGIRLAAVEGVALPCPRYVVRVPGGWQVRLPNEPTVFFADSRFDGAEGSHLAAVHHRLARMPMAEEGASAFARVERRNKKEPLGIPGVFLVHQGRRGKRTPSVYLHVINKGLPTRAIYVGTESTWEKRFPEKLAEAAAHREQRVRELSQRVGVVA